MIEREVKAVVVDPGAVVAKLEAAGAERTFRGRMDDLRYDREGSFTKRDEVVRFRRYRTPEGADHRLVLGWKGPVAVEGGAKLRSEIEIDARGDVEGWLAALGFAPVHRIDRFVDVFRLDSATIRLEWYPRMDVLIEIEGDLGAMERAIEAVGIEPSRFTAESLVDFVARFEASGRSAVLAVADLLGEPPSWDAIG